MRCLFISMGIGIVLILLCFLGLRQCSRLPSDAEMRGYFYEHKQVYTALVDMLHNDKDVRRICRDEIAVHDPKNATSDLIVLPIEQTSFSRGRFDEYRKLIAQIEAPSIWSDANQTVAFQLGGHGFAGIGTRWGYEWLPTPPPAKLILPTLDDFLKDGPYLPETDRYVHLDGNWYIRMHVAD